MFHDCYASCMCICNRRKKSVPTVIKDLKNVYVKKTVNGSNLYHLTITKWEVFHWYADVPCNSVGIRITLMRIRIWPFTFMRIQIRPFTTMQIRLRPYTLRRIQISSSLSTWWKSLTTGIQLLHGSILILQASTVGGQGPRLHGSTFWAFIPPDLNFDVDPVPAFHSDADPDLAN